MRLRVSDENIQGEQGNIPAVYGFLPGGAQEVPGTSRGSAAENIIEHKKK